MPEHLHPYWRLRYIQSRKDPQAGSPFATLLAAGDDQASLIVHRGRHCFIILNNSPYNPGHLMVLPNREVGELAALTAEERVELMDLLVRCQAVLTKVMQPSGFNMGLNLGKSAGAGIPMHLHFHVVPRWEGDQNFMPVLAETHILPQALADLWARLQPEFAAV
ncbi:hydrolase [Verrucomicrobiota bacterium]|nr:hydrolase [Verrucomicrobiota bacterium]